jgi:copper resistance protein C
VTSHEGRRSRGPRRLLPRLAFAACGALVALGSLVGPASAHAERIRSEPEEGVKLDAAPAELSISFTEPPTGDANLIVMDGCENDVVQDIHVENMSVSASLGEGQPGTWVVRSTVVSLVDGHQTQDSWTFAVKGSKDCSAPNDTGGEQARAAGDEDEDDTSSFPVLPVAIGAVVILGLAALLRVLTGRSSD